MHQYYVMTPKYYKILEIFICKHNHKPYIHTNKHISVIITRTTNINHYLRLKKKIIDTLHFTNKTIRKEVEIEEVK